ncbi:MAG: EcsC family protein [Candidatus Omnitrophica bacterium]|nr:EcsC family protein [Candidatus Omnitrophota bacterium]
MLEWVKIKGIYTYIFNKLLLNTEENSLREINRWQSRILRTGIAPAAINLAFSPLDELTDIVIPKKWIDKATLPVAKVIFDLQKISRKFALEKSVLAIAKKGGIPLNKLADLKEVPLEYKDVLAKSFFGKNVLYTTVQSLGLSTAGIASILVDLPLIITQSLKLIFQTGAAYGYSPDTDENKEFALRVFSITIASGHEQEKQIKKIDCLIRDLAKQKFKRASGVLASKKNTLSFAHSIVRGLFKKHIFREALFLGIAVGTVLNYYFVKETSIYSYMFYRKRFLIEKKEGSKK